MNLPFGVPTYSRLAINSASAPPPPDTLEYELADASAILQFQNMIDAIGQPKFLSISLYLTDAAGQNRGPHGDGLRECINHRLSKLSRIFDSL